MRTPLPALLVRIALRPVHLSRTAILPLPVNNNKSVITRTMSAAASTSTSRGRSPTRVPGPVETTIQQKVRPHSFYMEKKLTKEFLFLFLFLFLVFNNFRAQVDY